MLEGLHTFFDQQPNLLRVAHIGRDRQHLPPQRAQPLGLLAQVIFTARRQHHRGAGPNKTFGNACAQTPARAGNNCNLSL